MAYLIDKSMQDPRVQARLAPVIAVGEAARCAIIELEILYSTRNRDEHARTRARRRLAYRNVELTGSIFEPLPLRCTLRHLTHRNVELTGSIFERAIKVQGLLAARGQHRLPIPDLIIAAAAAEAVRVTVLHYAADFDTIAAVTRQETEWVAPQARSERPRCRNGPRSVAARGSTRKTAWVTSCPLVALEPDQVGAERGGKDLGDLGLADLAFQQQWAAELQRQVGWPSRGCRG